MKESIPEKMTPAIRETNRNNLERLRVLEESIIGTILDSEIAMIHIVSPEGVILKSNKMFKNLTGYSDEESVGRPLKEFFTEKSQMSFNEQFPVLCKKGYNRNTMDVITKDGKIMTVDCFSSAIRDEKGKILYFLIYQLDITSRMKEQAEMHMLKTAIETGMDGVAIFNREGKYTYLNNAYARIFGYNSPEELLYESSSTLCSEDSHRKFREEIMPQLLERGYWAGELTGRRKDGSLFPQQVALSKIENDYFACVTRDITDQKEMLSAVNRNLEIQEAINRILELSLQDLTIDDILRNTLDIILSIEWLSFESTGAIFLIEQPGTLTMKAERGLAEPIKKRCGKVRIGECLCGRAALSGEIQFSASLDSCHSIAYDGIVPHGHYCVPIELSGEVIGVINIYLKHGHLFNRIETGFLSAVGKALAGIIKRDRIEAQLLQSQKMEAIGQLAGGIAHDFNNLLTAIIGYGEMLRENIKEDDLSIGYLDQMLSAARKAANLVQDILAFGRKQVLNVQPVDLNQIVQKVVKFLRILLREDIEIKTILTKNQLIVMADENQIERVLINLATNARDAMPDGGVLTIETEVAELDENYLRSHGLHNQGSYALISVSDTGKGMDKKTMERIFEPFFTTKKGGTGMGLGLSIIYGIIKQHKGHINVYSEIDKGTIFKIYLPLSEAKPEKTEIELEEPITGGSETLLVAEDNGDVRNFIRSALENAGYRVIEACDGEEAVRKFCENMGSIDLVLLDIVMPRRSGIDAYEEIRSLQSNMKAIFMSGYAEDTIHQKPILNKNLKFISKPFAVNKLLEKIREVLDG